MNYRAKNITIAVGLAALAAVLTSIYVVNYKRHVQHGEGKVTVLVASRDIPAGTSGAEIVDQNMLKEQTVPRKAIVAGAISNPDQLSTYVATQDVYEGEQVTTRRFSPPKEQGIRSMIKGTQRAYELSGEPHQLLAGTLKDGDTVDVVGTWQDPESVQHHVSRMILRNMLVMRAPEGKADVRRRSPRTPNKGPLRQASPHRRAGAEAALVIQQVGTFTSCPRRSDSRPPSHGGHSQDGRKSQQLEGLWRRRSSNELERHHPSASGCGSSSRARAKASTSSASRSRAPSPRSRWSVEHQVADGVCGVLAGGHLEAVLHATRSSSSAGGRARDRFASTPALRSCSSPRAKPRACSSRHWRRTSPTSCSCRRWSRTSSSPSARPADTARRHHHAAAPAGTARSSRCSRRRAARARRSRRRTSPRRSRSSRARRRCSSTSTCSSATPRSCSGSSPRRRSTTSSSPRASSTPRSSPATRPGTVGPRHPARAAAAGGRRARHRGEAVPPARGGARVVRRHRRRHVAVLPRADARDPRPDGRAAARLLARRPDVEERQARAADARAARPSRRTASASSSTAPTQGRDEADRGRGRARGEGALRGPQRPGRADRREPRQPGGPRRGGRGLLEGDPRDGEGSPAGRGSEGGAEARPLQAAS